MRGLSTFTAPDIEAIKGRQAERMHDVKPRPPGADGPARAGPRCHSRSYAASAPSPAWVGCTHVSVSGPGCSCGACGLFDTHPRSFRKAGRGKHQSGRGVPCPKARSQARRAQNGEASWHPKLILTVIRYLQLPLPWRRGWSWSRFSDGSIGRFHEDG
jgi:hypothetical protein